MNITTSQNWALAAKPTGFPVLAGPDSTFRLERRTIPDLAKDEVLLKTLYLSNDPAQRQWIDPSADPARLYVKPVEVGEVMPCVGSICEVIKSSSEDVAVGTRVFTMGAWSDYIVQPAASCKKLDAEVDGASLTLVLGIFGPAGVSAYYGLVDIGAVTEKDVVIISGASGAVGSAAVQIAKHLLGCKRVIGIAGEDTKCRWVESLGANVCLNYKEDTFEDSLRAATDGFVDVFFDNVGGHLLDQVLARTAKFGRVVACGLSAGYNDSSQGAVTNWYQIIAMRIKVLGFVVLDLSPERWSEIVETLVGGVKSGKMRADESGETVVPVGFADIPSTWMMLFKGGSTGKTGKLISKLEL